MAFNGLLFCTTCGNLLPRVSKAKSPHITCELCKTVNTSAFLEAICLRLYLTVPQTNGLITRPQLPAQPTIRPLCSASATTSPLSRFLTKSLPPSRSSTKNVLSAIILRCNSPRGKCVVRMRGARSFILVPNVGTSIIRTIERGGGARVEDGLVH